MFFKSLAGLLAGNTAVTLLVTGTEEAMTVTVIPKPSKTGEGMEALSTPMSLTGSAAELDEGFCGYLEKFTSAIKSLEEQFDATATVLNAAKKASAEKAVKGVSKAAKTSEPASSAAHGSTDTDPENPDDEGGNASESGTAPPAPASNPDNLFA